VESFSESLYAGAIAESQREIVQFECLGSNQGGGRAEKSKAKDENH
jgi:hypothetical protein